jgi:hypothetical protein
MCAYGTDECSDKALDIYYEYPFPNIQIMQRIIVLPIPFRYLRLLDFAAIFCFTFFAESS